MSMDDFILLEDVKGILVIKEKVSKYDEVISALINPISTVVFLKLGVAESDLVTDDEKTFMKVLIAVHIGCQILLGDPSFGAKYKEYKIGNVTKTFLSRIKKDFEDWCTLRKELMNEAYSIFGEGFMASGPRLGVSDEYPTPY